LKNNKYLITGSFHVQCLENLGFFIFQRELAENEKGMNVKSVCLPKILMLGLGSILNIVITKTSEKFYDNMDITKNSW
jgi:hypothetical protein